MRAFDCSPVTPTRTHDPSQDGATKPCRSLSLGEMCSPGALPGTAGTHTEVISGNWQQIITGSAKVSIDGSSDTTVQGHSDTTVNGNVTEKFNQNHTTTVGSNVTQKVHGNSTTYVTGSEHNTTLGPTLETRIGEHTQVHQAPEHNQDTSGFQTHATAYDAYGFRFEADGCLVCPIGVHIDLVGTRMTAGVALYEYQVFGTHWKALHNEDSALDTRFKGMEDKITGLEDNLTPVTIKVNPVRIISTGLYVVAGPPVVGSILNALVAELALDALIAQFALAAAI